MRDLRIDQRVLVMNEGFHRSSLGNLGCVLGLCSEAIPYFSFPGGDRGVFQRSSLENLGRVSGFRPGAAPLFSIPSEGMEGADGR